MQLTKTRPAPACAPTTPAAIPASIAVIFLIFAAPLLVFLGALLRPLPAVAGCAVLLAVVALIVRRTDWRGRPDIATLAAALATAALLNLLSGIGHFFWQTDDWTVRDAMLFDLVRNPWPVSYALADGAGLLRAPLGMYLVPALAGKAGGLGAAQATLFVQNTALLGLCVYTFALVTRPGWPRYVAIGLFVAFSGLDIVGYGIRAINGMPRMAAMHLEPWTGRFQYASNVTEIFWTPHHALAGWALVAAYLAARAGRISTLAIAPLFAGCLLWSPLACFGAAPFLVFTLICDTLDGRLRRADVALCAASLALAAPVMAFLAIDSGQIEQGFQNIVSPTFLVPYAGLVALEVLPLFALAWHGRDPSDRRTTVEMLMALSLLLVIPAYTLGFANDFAMRVSIPALTLLYVRTPRTLAGLGAEPVARRAAMLGVIALGAATPAVEIYRNVSQRATPASACNVLESLQDGPYAGSPLDYYIARASTFGKLQALFRQEAGAPVERKIEKCWPGRTFVFGPPLVS